MQNLISIKQLNRNDIDKFIDIANSLPVGSMEYRSHRQIIIYLLFFEASTRTRLGFESAAHRLGASPVVVAETKNNSNMSAAESIQDTISATEGYTDVICLRHPQADLINKIYTKKPIINAGNGFDEHPTQALIDLMTISNIKGAIDGLKIAIIGDLKFSRAAHSLILALSKYNGMHIKLISPAKLSMPKKYYDNPSIKVEVTEKLSLDDVDTVYVAGFPPRNPDGEYSEEERLGYRISKKILDKHKNINNVLCPLPRIDEIDADIDNLKQAKYFLQSSLGLNMRMAILKKLLNI